MEKGANYIKDEQGNYIKVTPEEKEHILKVRTKYPQYGVKDCLHYPKPPRYTCLLIVSTSEDTIKQVHPCASKEEAEELNNRFNGKGKLKLTLSDVEEEYFNWYYN